VAAHRTSATVTSTLRRQLLTRAVALGPSWLAGERTGELAASATQGVDALDGYFARYLPTLVLSALTPVILLACIVVRDWFSAVILALTVAVIPLFMILLGLEATRNADRQWARLSGLAATFYDLLQGLPTLRAFGRTDDGRHTLARANRELHDETMSTLKVAFLSSLALETMASVGTALVALFLGLRLLHGSLPLGTALAILVLAPEVYLPLRRAGAEFHSSAEGRAAAARILDVLDAADAVVVPTDAADVRPLPDPARHPLRLADITVRHTGRSQAVLDEVDLELRPGEHLAVVGESGSGKSTLLNVLMGFVVPESGGVLVGDRLLTPGHLRDWRRQVAWVPQRPALVRGTLEDNLRLGNPDASAGDVRRALERSGLDGLVARLPGGLATPVGEGGLTLSAGERQRIAIGRAVLRDVPVVLLDEPTAHLDAAREEELRHVLAPWLEGRSVVMAAHRGGLLGRVDRTVTLLAGHVVAGPPATARPATAPPDVARAAAAARPFGTGGTG
jgi:ATP-binding cassette subfamily C protein CydCD